MKKSIALFFATLAVGLLFADVACAGTAEATTGSGIIPAPARCIPGAGRFEMNAKARIFFTGGDGVADTAKLLRDELKERTGIHVLVGELKKGTAPAGAIVLELEPADKASSKSPEQYSLRVDSNQITLRAQSSAGLFYGVQSLLQMAAANQSRAGNTIPLPAMSITDAPRFEWRGVMLDESRHFFGKQTVKELLDMMATLKLNRFHWHLTDEPGWRIEIKKYPRLTTIGAQGNWSDPEAPARFYTQADIREIVGYAAARHIMVIPEIDMPGHATAACRAYPEFSGGGTGQWKGFTFNPAKEATYQFLEDVLSEVVALFPAPYIHLGGDEVHFGNQSWSTDPEILKFTHDHGMTNAVQLEQYFVRRMAGVIQRLGKTTMGWDEIAGAGVPPTPSGTQLLTQLLEQDYRVVLCPRLPLYFDFVQDNTHKSGRRWKGKFNPLADVYSFPGLEIEALIPPGKATNVLGIEACLWTEHIQNHERLAFMTYPRIAALAEAAWTPEAAKDTNHFNHLIPAFLRELQRREIPYFNPLEPAATPEPPGPEKKAAGTANG